MGEYFIICNFDKKEVLDPGVFGHGNKPGDFLAAASDKGILHGLLHLLSLGGSVGRAELRQKDPMYGRWAGDRIVIIGDYYEGPVVAGVIWKGEDHYIRVKDGEDGWVDISEHVVRAIGGKIPDDREDIPRSVLHPDGTVTTLPRRD